MRSRRWILAPAVLALALAAATVAALTYRTSYPGCGGCDTFSPDPRLSPEINEELRYLKTELIRRAVWSEEDVARLGGILARGLPPRPPIGSPEADWEPYVGPNMVHGLVRSAISEKLRRSTKLTQPVRERLGSLLLATLDDPDPKSRTGAVQAVVYARLVTDPEIRTRVEKMMNDPDQQVASNATRQLAAFDEFERLRALGRYKEPPPFGRPER